MILSLLANGIMINYIQLEQIPSTLGIIVTLHILFSGFGQIMTNRALKSGNITLLFFASLTSWGYSEHSG